MWGIDVGAGCAACVGFVGSVFLWGACRISGTKSRFYRGCLPQGLEKGIIGAVDTTCYICSVREREVGSSCYPPHLHDLPHQ